MEKALVCGELSEEEGMLQLERAQLSDISDMTRNRDEDLIHELQKTIQERSLRIDSLKVRSKMGQSRVKTRFFQCKNRSFQGISWVLLKGKKSVLPWSKRGHSSIKTEPFRGHILIWYFVDCK